MKSALAALLLVAGLAAQDPGLEVRMAADPEGSGPTAWAWLRQNLLARIPDWPAELDPSGALTAHLQFDGSWTASADPAPLTDHYLAFELRDADATLVSGTCSESGHSRWLVQASERALPSEISALVERFGMEARNGGLTIDLATATGNLMAGAPPGDLCGEALTVSAMDCGEVAVMARPHSSQPMTWIVHGQSDGGLLLPAMLVCLADRQARRAVDESDSIERWLLLAATAEGEERLEALRQLTRFDDPRATEALQAAQQADLALQLAAAPSRPHPSTELPRPLPEERGSSTRDRLLSLAIASALLFAAMLVIGRRRGAIA